MVRGRTSHVDSVTSDLDSDVSTHTRYNGSDSKAYKTWNSGKNPWTLSKPQRSRSNAHKALRAEHLHTDVRKTDEEFCAREDEPDLKDNMVHSEDELPLSDPRSWIWKDRKDARVAVVVDSRHICTSGILPWQPDGNVDSDTADESGDAVQGKPKGRLWLQKVEIPLLSITESKLNHQKPLKNSTIDSFFVPKPGFSNKMPKGRSHCAKLNSRDRAKIIKPPKRGSHLSQQKSPLAANHHKTLLNNSSTNTINISLRHTRLPRAAASMRTLSVETTELSLSDDDGSSMSDIVASTTDSDEFSGSASVTDTETASQSGDAEEVSDEDMFITAPSPKRQKSLRPSPSRKRTKKLDSEVSTGAEDSEEVDGPLLSTLPTSIRKKCATDYQKGNNYTYRVGIDENLQPLCKTEEIFVDMTARACKLGFMKVVKHLQNRKLRVGTMCSGTESPILALRLVSDALKKEQICFEIQQVFAAEIEAWKQAYGEYNIGPPIMFRDVRDFSLPNASTATTAYGALVEIPGDLDLLVAGFSCVDFSGLNNKKKTLESGGESGDTFKGIRDYAERWRPKIIILENVSGAPWDRIRDQAMAAIGYRAEYLRVDTKEYYLPHTRVRGYMICVDARKYHDPNGVNHVPKSPQLMTSILKTWVDTMKAFKRPASCSIEAFLLDEDDPRLSRAREELSERDNTRSRVIDWACCHGRHQDYRMALSLGPKRPITKWLEGGFCEPLDFMWIDFIRTQPERVQDMIDISYLRNLDRGFDHHFKTRILELSQNVDRVTDNTKAGVTGCITPTGIPFSTTRGGPLTGLEVLSIQGLPIDRLRLSRQKQSQLQDLAGNAMSSTVVGAAILSALIAGYQSLPADDNDVLKYATIAPLSRICTEQDLNSSAVVLSTYEPLSVAAALEASKQSVRMCLCEGPLNVTSLPLHQCTFCQHTTCVKCSGNPLHAYAAVPEEIVLQRKPPTIFADLIKKALPMIVSLIGITDEKITQLSQNYKDQIEITDWNILLAFVHKAFRSEFRFYSIKRSEIWTVRYESGDAHLELIISPHKLEWRIFGKPPREDAGNSRLRQLLSHPIARMVPKGGDITQGIWQFWLPKVHKFAVCFTGRGGLTSSYEDRVGIIRYVDTQVWREYSVTISNGARDLLDADICGDYKLRQDCGTASGALHVRTNTNENSKPVFLFLDPHSLHDPKEDFFVFSTDKRRLNYGDVRARIARLDPNWRPQKLEKLEDSSAEAVRYKINNSTKPVAWAEAQLPKTVDCYVDGRWIDLPDAQFRFSRDEGELSCYVASALPLLPSLNSCGTAHVIFLGKAKLPERQAAPWSQNEWVEISAVDYSEFFKSQAWLTEKACVLENFATWSYGSASSLTLCSDCAPPSPTIKWKLQAPKSDKKADCNVEASNRRKKELLKYVPFEDPGEAARHERLLKNRPSPLVTQVLINDAGFVQLKLAINPETLMHRALAKLSSCQNKAGISLKWRLITTYSMPSRPSLPHFTLKDNKSDARAKNPSSFLYPLRPEQARSLDWMISQESGQGQKFREEETEEAVIPQIRWRAEGRAEKDVYVRGGVLADQVGYGKTVTTLALIASQRRQDAELAKTPVQGCIPLKATLILVPPQLPDQWDREVNKFLDKNDKYKVLVIKNLAALQSKTIAHFHEANIIIASWRLCEGDNYLFKVAQFAGMVELAEKSTNRASTVWYEEAMKAIADHVDELKRGGEGLKDMISMKLAENEKKAMEVVTVIPSKRLRGQAYQAAKEDPAPGSKRKYGQARSLDSQTRKPRPDDFGFEQLKKGKMNWTAMKCPLLELFRFARIVVDEYTYVTGQESLTISNIQARCRWILSATPPLVDFIDVKNIAKFLGVHLGIEDITPGITKLANIKALEKEKTDSELFQSFKPSQSPAWHERRNEVAQRFLHQFARQNIADINAIKGSEHIRPVKLPAAERAIYLENSQNLLLNDLTIKKGRRNVDNDRARRFQELADRSTTPGEILMKCASHFTLDDAGIETSNALQACERIVAIRREQANRLKEDFQKRLKQAVWLNGVCSITVKQYVNWRNHVDTNAFGDLESMNGIKSMISLADERRKDTDWRDFYITAKQKAEVDQKIQKLKTKKKARTRRETDSEPEESIPRNNRRVKPEGVDHLSKERAVFELREVTAELRRLSAELVNRQRCLRFFERVRELQQFYALRGENVVLSEECTCSKCAKNDLSPDSISILCQCGHVICDNCLGPKQKGLDQCIAQGCSASNKPYQIIKAEELGVEGNREPTAKHYGKKIEDIVALVKKIPEDEQVLLFVQFSDLMAMIASAFRDDKITYSALGESGDPAKKLTEFQTNKDTSSMRKVLMLNIGDSSAAGSNLTNANHVIFVSPFLTDNDTLFNQAMTQAEGRARRYGQLKHVHIYRFLSLKTIDVDVIQARNKGKFVAKNWAAEPEVKPFDSFLPSTYDLVEEQRGVSNEFGSGEAGSKILGL